MLHLPEIRWKDLFASVIYLQMWFAGHYLYILYIPIHIYLFIYLFTSTNKNVRKENMNLYINLLPEMYVSHMYGNMLR